MITLKIEIPETLNDVQKVVRDTAAVVGATLLFAGWAVMCWGIKKVK